jgi:hypothetical protein
MRGQVSPFRSGALGKIWRGSPSLVHYLFAFVLIVRVIALTRLSSSSLLLPAEGDMHFYDEWARRIATGVFTDHQAFYGLPAYAYLLALLYRIFGYSPFVPGLLQACLDAGTAAFLYKISLRIFSTPADAKLRVARITGVLSAVGWAFFLPAQAYSIILMPTAGMVFVFWFVVWKIVEAEKAPSPLRTLAYGALMGVTASAVATILFLVPLLLVALFVKADSGKKPVSRFLAIALLCGGLGLGTAPCWIHNVFVARDPVFLSAHGGINFWLGNNPEATGYPHFPGLRAGQTQMLRDSIQFAETSEGRTLKRSEVSSYWSTKARAYIIGNPGSWIKLMARKVANFWNAFEYDDLGVLEHLRAQGVVLPGWRFGLVAIFAIPGIFLSFFRFAESRWIAGAILLHFLAVIPTFVTERYRLAVVPGLLIFAAFGLVFLWERVAARDYGRCAIYGTILSAACLFITIPRRNPELWATIAYNSGRLALDSHDLSRAEQNLERAYAYVPANSEVNFALGNLRFAQGNKERAKFFYRAALGLGPNHLGALRNLGVIALGEQEWNSAIELFRAALKIDPLDARTHYLLARGCLEAGDLNQAFSEIRRALELKADQPEFLELSGLIESRR